MRNRGMEIKKPSCLGGVAILVKAVSQHSDLLLGILLIPLKLRGGS